MKILIVYGSTYGFTEECVDKLKELLGEGVKAVNLSKSEAIDPEDYDTVILGGSVYLGQIQKPVKEFISTYKSVLLKKRLAIFLSCGFLENYDSHVKHNFDLDILDRSFARGCFGGELRFERMSFIHKLISRIVQMSARKAGKEATKLVPGSIEIFAQKIISSE